MVNTRPQQRRQHYVPKFYLKRFARGKKLQTYERPSRAIRTMTVRNAAVESDIYTVGMQDGTKSAFVEEALATLEGQTAAALDRITKGGFPPSVEDRAVISEFIAWQVVRTPLSKRLSDLMAEQQLKMITRMPWNEELVRRSFGDRDEPAIDEEIRGILDAIESGEMEDLTVKVSTEEWVKGMPAVVGEATDILFKKAWILGRAHGDQFVTSDNPVTVWSPPEKTKLTGVGILTADEVRIALDPKHMLIIAAPGTVPEMAIDLKRDAVAAANATTCWLSYRWVYQHPSGDDISSLIPDTANPVMHVISGLPPRKRRTG